MPGTVTPGQMFDHELNPVKGWPSPYAVDKALEFAAGVTGVLAGQVVHIDPTEGKMKLGAPNPVMALFAFPNQADFDVSTDIGNIMGGIGMGLVAIGAYELESTEFESDTYAPNDTLQSAAGGGDAGNLKKGTLGSENIVGVVSDGVFTNENAKSMLRFWPVYQPDQT